MSCNALFRQVGGGRGIRTLDTVSRIHAFQACAFNHSATSPSSNPADPSRPIEARQGRWHRGTIRRKRPGPVGGPRSIGAGYDRMPGSSSPDFETGQACASAGVLCGARRPRRHPMADARWQGFHLHRLPGRGRPSPRRPSSRRRPPRSSENGPGAGTAPNALRPPRVTLPKRVAIERRRVARGRPVQSHHPPTRPARSR